MSTFNWVEDVATTNAWNLELPSGIRPRIELQVDKSGTPVWALFCLPVGLVQKLDATNLADAQTEAANLVAQAMRREVAKLHRDIDVLERTK